MTEVVRMKEAEVATVVKDLLDSSTNTDQMRFVDATSAGAIAQNCAYLIHQEKELEAEIGKKDQIRRNQQVFTKFYETSLNEYKRKILRELHDKFQSFQKWNVEKVEGKTFFYSSKSPKEIMKGRENTGEKTETEPVLKAQDFIALAGLITIA